MVFMALFSVAGVSYASSGVEGEGPGKSREEMRRELEEFKMKFIAQEINLQSDQQKRFMELYSQMQDEKVKVFTNAIRIDYKVRKDRNATEADFEQAAKAMNEAKERDAEIDKRFDKEFSTFLSAKQIYLMKAAEEKFRRRMHEMRKQRGPKPQD